MVAESELAGGRAAGVDFGAAVTVTVTVGLGVRPAPHPASPSINAPESRRGIPVRMILPTSPHFLFLETYRNVLLLEEVLAMHAAAVTQRVR